MENLRNSDENGGLGVGLDADYIAYEDEDVTNDAPPAIGQDERRMHVRAYNFWAGLLGERQFPSVEDLDPESDDDFGPNSVLLDFTNGVENPSIQFLGKSCVKNVNWTTALARSIRCRHARSCHGSPITIFRLSQIRHQLVLRRNL